MFHVYIEALEFYGHHGVSAEEQSVGHRFRADMRLEVDGRADETDLLEDTVDYSALAGEALAVSEARRFATVEALARAIAARMLSVDPRVMEARVKVAKVHPPMAYPVRSAAVEVTLRRNG